MNTRLRMILVAGSLAGLLAIDSVRASSADDPPPAQGEGQPQRPEGGRPENAPPGGGRRPRDAMRDANREPGARPLADDPRVMREALQRTIEHLKLLAPRLEKALAELDAGKDAGEVRRELAQQRAEGLSGLMESLRTIGFAPGAGLGGRRGQDGDGPPPGMGPGGPGGGEMGERPGPGGPGGPKGPGGGGQNRPGAGPEKPAELLAMLKELVPGASDQIETMRKVSPKEADRMLIGIGARLVEIRDLAQRDPEFAQLKREEIKGLFDVIRARREYQEAKKANAGEDRLATLRSALREVMARQWDVRQAQDEHQIKLLQQRIDRAKADQKARSANRDKQIDERTKEMIDGPDREGRGEPGRRPRRDDPAHEPKKPD